MIDIIEIIIFIIFNSIIIFSKANLYILFLNIGAPYFPSPERTFSWGINL